ncbi:MICOS complex subunit Mic10 [Octopus bimaculoides]|uniref:MICOS complex subunit MIC10 n=1 Tax=Octopus bimaculoides TaxID=37653 RepID=A0A0L8HKJ4_OCTBM|nr:MICOS complex subunit Mic10 [Octopus bimaculoides]|eukprot:XP_014771601.1 PREDICTED: MICOS complex subunit Mic10-like [Octopus bimaculoides]
MSKEAASEKVLGLKFDQCVSDLMIKTATGLGLGIIFSVTLFKRRPWPVAFGIGAGLGMAYSNCQNEFKHPLQSPGRYVKVERKEST